MTISPRSSQHRRSVVILVAIAAAFGACEGDDTAQFGPTRDDAAMEAIASAWTEDGGLALSLCEDTARSAAWPGPDGCQVDHVVRGGGLGLSHSEKHPNGCSAGGCPYRVVAYVRGTASSLALGGAVTVIGEVRLQSTSADDPYGHPYTLDLECTDAGTPCAVTGALRADGTISLRLGDKIDAAARRMRDENVGFAPVCTDDAKPVGAIVDRDGRLAGVMSLADIAEHEDDARAMRTIRGVLSREIRRTA